MGVPATSRRAHSASCQSGTGRSTELHAEPGGNRLRFEVHRCSALEDVESHAGGR